MDGWAGWSGEGGPRSLPCLADRGGPPPGRGAAQSHARQQLVWPRSPRPTQPCSRAGNAQITATPGAAAQQAAQQQQPFGGDVGALLFCSEMPLMGCQIGSSAATERVD